MYEQTQLGSKKFFHKDKTPGELAISLAIKKSINGGHIWKNPLKSIKGMNCLKKDMWDRPCLIQL